MHAWYDFFFFSLTARCSLRCWSAAVFSVYNCEFVCYWDNRSHLILCKLSEDSCWKQQEVEATIFCSASLSVRWWSCKFRICPALSWMCTCAPGCLCCLIIGTCLLCWDSPVWSRWTVRIKLRVIEGFCVRLKPCVILMTRLPFSSIYCHVYHPSPPVGQSEERSDGSSSGSGAGSGPGESSALPPSDITSPGIRHFEFLFVCLFVYFFNDDHFDKFSAHRRSWPHSSGHIFALPFRECVPKLTVLEVSPFWCQRSLVPLWFTRRCKAHFSFEKHLCFCWRV